MWLSYIKTTQYSCLRTNIADGCRVMRYEDFIVYCIVDDCVSGCGDRPGP